MKRAVTNYFVDVVIGIAFLVAAVSSIVFLLPTSWVSVSDGQTSLLGVDMATWSWLHKWSGLAMIAGVVLHTLLHTRWIVTMTRRVFGRPAKERRPAAAAGPAAANAAAAQCRPIPAAAANVAAPQARPLPAAPVLQATSSKDTTAGAPHGAAAVREPASSRAVVQPAPGAAARNDRGEGQPLYTRKAFLGAAATIVAGATVVGLTMADRGSGVSVEQSSPSAATQSDQSGSGNSWGSSGEDAGPTQSEESAGSPGAAQTEEPVQSAQAAARVTVDEGSCTACGNCLQTCPAGVFAFSGGTAIAASPDSCSLCGRCLQVCRPQAITLSS
jgi:NAD-dependent dihydropyrimidine dehydrogenase PreA subunit